MSEAVDSYFPTLREQLNRVPDGRTRPEYCMADVIFAVIAMFILKSTSRNNFNQTRRRGKFSQAFSAIFNYKMPHMDTVHNIIEKIAPEHLEVVTITLIRTLLKRGTLNSLRLLSGYHVISVDGVMVMKFSEPVDGTTKKESKNGVKTFTRSCIQARVVTANGFAIPILTEWIETADGASKEDCELNAFKRLAIKLRQYFPKLSICLVGDALYANDSVFSICASYNWKFIVTLKDKLKTVHAKVHEGKADVLYPVLDLVPAFEDDGGVISDNVEVPNAATHCVEKLYRRLEWLGCMFYRDHKLGWVACTEATIEGEQLSDCIYYAWLTNIELNRRNILTVERAARLGRAAIEDAFNTGKNRGYAMKHKFARKSFNAAKNYMTCMHIAEALNQLVVLSEWFQLHIMDVAKETLKALWTDIICELRSFDLLSLPELLSHVPKNHSYQ